MSLSEALIQEFSTESVATRKLLERVPEDKLSWSPHEKSMSLAQLATHVAEIPQWATTIVDQVEFDVGAGGYTPHIASSRSEILEIFDKNAELFTSTLKGTADDVLMAVWKLKNEGEVLADMPRIAALRAFLLNHLVHHRGQLTVLLRLCDVPLPSVYGPTADEGF